jgi:hypothetical protein
MDLSDTDLKQFAEADRREVDPPIPVEIATWSHAGQLDWWVKDEPAPDPVNEKLDRDAQHIADRSGSVVASIATNSFKGVARWQWMNCSAMRLSGVG